MNDAYGRTIDYMRISITDRCNLRCRYCMPEGVKPVLHRDILSFEEIRQIAACGAGLGIRHIKVTGGEPLVRKGCVGFIAALKAVPGIETVTLTTNGILLEQYLEPLIEAGIDGINISLDTLDRELYKKITGLDGRDSVLHVLEKAAACTVPIKINTVSVDWGELDNRDKKEAGEEFICKNKRENHVTGRKAKDNWKEIARLAQKYPVDVRFIEMMPIGYGKAYKTVDHRKLLDEMKQEFPGMERDEKKHGFGPAVYYRVPGFFGSIGLISAVHGKFCENCNRVRLTAQGYLKTCLCFDKGADLRAVLRGKGWQEDGGRKLAEVMKEEIGRKPAAHCFDMPEKITEQRNMVDIGG